MLDRMSAWARRREMVAGSAASRRKPRPSRAEAAFMDGRRPLTRGREARARLTLSRKRRAVSVERSLGQRGSSGPISRRMRRAASAIRCCTLISAREEGGVGRIGCDGAPDAI